MSAITTWRKTWDLFFEALEHPAEARAQYLRQACDDPALRQEVEDLLAAHERAPVLLDMPPVVRDEPDSDFIGRHIGRYRIVREIGSGGMGTVYEAEQETPVRRKVALKLIKLGMDTREVVARFEQERQALAIMSHTNIARVFDGGASDEGRPYFVMELVDGVPLTEYCDAQRLLVSERLALMMAVCDGVQHAHQKGIIHRDLKPSNVLVAVESGAPVPKIIDFGVAKAILDAPGEQTAMTRLGSMIGTPVYMSPEQFQPDAGEADTRTDVYALAVMLYQLLAGCVPFDRRGHDSMRQIVLETDAARPSTRLARMPEVEAAEIAARRATGLRELLRIVRGDLDSIALKGLAKERSARYATPNELAADLQRYLRHQPILAHPPSIAYGARKFVRRHRIGVAMAAAIAVLVFGFAIAMTVQSVRLQRALTVAEREQARAEQVSAFLVNLFRSANPQESGRANVTVREILDTGAKRVATELAAQPDVKVQLLQTIGSAYRELGDYKRAREMIDQALAQLPDDPALAGAVYNALGEISQDQGDLDAAARAYGDAVAARRKVKDGEGPLSESLNNVAVLHLDRGELQPGLTAGREALALRERVFGHVSREVAQTSLVVGRAHLLLGDLAASDPFMRDGVTLTRRLLGDGHHSLGTALNTQTALLRAMGRHDEAIPLLRKSLAIYERTLGPQHSYVATTLINLSQSLAMSGHYPESEKAATQAVETLSKLFSNDHPSLTSAAYVLATAHYLQGEYALAESGFRTTYEVDRKIRPASLNVAASAHWVGTVARVLGRLDDAKAMLQQSLDLRIAGQGGAHPDAAATRVQLGLVLAARGDAAGGRALLENALDVQQQKFGPQHRRVALNLQALADVALAQGDVAGARGSLQQALAIQDKVLRSEHPERAASVHALALVERAAGDLLRAEELLRAALALRRQSLAPEHPDTANTLAALADLLCAATRSSDGRPLMVEAKKIFDGSAPLAVEHAATLRSAISRCR